MENTIKLKALKYNLITVKETISRANLYIGPDIYAKQEMEGLRITLERILGKHKAKKDKHIRDELSIKLNKLKSEIAGVTKVLEKYNNETTVENLILISV